MTEWSFHPTLVAPFYLELMNANVLRLSGQERADFMAAFRQASARVTDEELQQMLDSSWRPGKAAAWFIAHGRRTQFVPTLEAMLLDRPIHAEHLCIALAVLAAPSTPAAMQAYLDLCASTRFEIYDCGESCSADKAMATIEMIGDEAQIARAEETWASFLEAQRQCALAVRADERSLRMADLHRETSERGRSGFKTTLDEVRKLLADEG